MKGVMVYVVTRLRLFWKLICTVSVEWMKEIQLKDLKKLSNLPCVTWV